MHEACLITNNYSVISSQIKLKYALIIFIILQLNVLQYNTLNSIILKYVKRLANRISITLVCRGPLTKICNTNLIG